MTQDLCGESDVVGGPGDESAVSIRRSIDPFNAAAADLESAGRLALLEALQRFDVSRGAKFTTYAYHFVRGAMLAELYPHVERRRERSKRR